MAVSTIGAADALAATVLLRMMYGLMAAVMALVGDLTVSLLKRSAGFKVRCGP